MIVNERQTEEGLLVSVCDPDVMGETFEDGPVSLTVSEEFYGGEHRDEDAVLDSLRRATVANIVGKRSVDVAVEAGIIDEDAVLAIEGTLHAQLLRLG
ncbi:DUF424 domain-containing protein [Haloarchaeobius sp. DT45]|uniref:DUF424 domain-containing protein n=1 Tax=Haloarchaeobius sp. DT45 TaxID=3446116 RepID=UPI003F6C1E1C